MTSRLTLASSWAWTFESPRRKEMVGVMAHFAVTVTTDANALRWTQKIIGAQPMGKLGDLMALSSGRHCVDCRPRGKQRAHHRAIRGGTAPVGCLS